MARAQAEAGVDMVGPSGMMDGQVRVIREALDAAEHQGVSILAYSAKYASAFYGPFREAVDSSLEGDRRTYQQDSPNALEGVREALLDVAEGADIVMVKPAPGLPRRHPTCPRRRRRAGRGLQHLGGVLHGRGGRRPRLDRPGGGDPRDAHLDPARRCRRHPHLLGGRGRAAAASLTVAGRRGCDLDRRATVTGCRLPSTYPLTSSSPSTASASTTWTGAATEMPCCCWQDWAAPATCMRLAPHLSDRFRVVALTRRGHGLSDQAHSGHALADAAEDARRFLDALGIQRAHVGGALDGWGEASALAARHPGRVGKVVYLDGAYDWVDRPGPAASDEAASPDRFASYEDYVDFVHSLLPDEVSGPALDAMLRTSVDIHADGSVVDKLPEEAFARCRGLELVPTPLLRHHRTGAGRVRRGRSVASGRGGVAGRLSRPLSRGDSARSRHRDARQPLRVPRPP